MLHFRYRTGRIGPGSAGTGRAERGPDRAPAGIMAAGTGTEPGGRSPGQGTNPNMDEATPSGSPAPSAPVRAGLGIDRIYLRDLSFESPRAPGAFASEWKPQFRIELNTRADRLGDGRFEVVLMLNLEAKSGDDTLFMVELQQAGVFRIEAADEEERRETLGVACPEILFPYARETVDTLLVKGTFPPFMLAPVSFDALYAEARKRREEAQPGG